MPGDVDILEVPGRGLRGVRAATVRVLGLRCAGSGSAGRDAGEAWRDGIVTVTVPRLTSSRLCRNPYSSTRKSILLLSH